MPTSSTSHMPWPDRPPPRPPTTKPVAADEPDVPPPIVLRCLAPDARAIARRLPDSPGRREHPGSAADAYLDHLIGKPWGEELRIYDDALLDVWMLRLKGGTRTSAHCHPFKHTVLLCLEGHGVVTAGDASTLAISRGSVLQIEPGAAHRTAALTDVVLVEVETPRDKFDLVRLEDQAGRRGRAYEPAGAVRQRLARLADVADGPPRARLRPPSATAPYRFALERGSELKRAARRLVVAISLDPLGILRREIALAGPGSLGDLTAEHTYLTIRSAHQGDQQWRTQSSSPAPAFRTTTSSTRTTA